MIWIAAFAAVALPSFEAPAPLNYPFVAKWRGQHGTAVGLCTAELIAPLYIITAAHCATRMLKNETVHVHVEFENATTTNLRRDVVQHSCVHAPRGTDVAICRLIASVPPAEVVPVALVSDIYRTGESNLPEVECVGTYHGLHATGPKALLAEKSGQHVYVDNTNASGMHAGDSGGAWVVRSARARASADEQLLLVGVIHGGETNHGKRLGVAAQVAYIGGWINATTNGTARWRSVEEEERPPVRTTATTTCNATNKQKALYLEYEYFPGESPEEMAVYDISVGHAYNATAGLTRYGANGIYAAQPIELSDGPGGYFGSQVDGGEVGGLLFSIWDGKRKGKGATCSEPDKAPNATWCARKHAFPLSPSCHRNCNDCALHPGWHNTTGTQCSVKLSLRAGDRIDFRLWKTSNGTTLHDPLGMGLTYQGSVWTLSATNHSDATQVWTVGEIFFEDSYGGVGRFNAFHEHIGCTPCLAFFESEVRIGPYAIEPGHRVVRAIRFNPIDAQCEAYAVRNLTVDGIPAAQISTGPGSGPGALRRSVL